MTIFVQFTDSTKTAIQAVFGCAQDAAAYPNQGEIDDDDALYLAFSNPSASAAGVREQRNALVSATDWLVQRHRDQLDESESTTLTTAQYTSLQAYRTALRGVPEQSGFPASVDWPAYPL
jgi:alkylhydroperoxidase family enzyme